jgi:hypothetical protein
MAIIEFNCHCPRIGSSAPRLPPLQKHHWHPSQHSHGLVQQPSLLLCLHGVSGRHSQPCTFPMPTISLNIMTSFQPLSTQQHCPINHHSIPLAFTLTASLVLLNNHTCSIHYAPYFIALTQFSVPPSLG